MTTNRIRAIVAIADWQHTHNPVRPYRLHELMRALRIDSATAAFALKLNGWHRDRMRETRMNRRQLTTWWIPPNGKSLKPRRRGRPSYIDLLNQS
jgi:hypothetical protein